MVLQSKPQTDTSALEARNGKDIQGIPWDRLNFTRDKYRETRLKQYKNYENLSLPRFELDQVCLLEFLSRLYCLLGIDLNRDCSLLFYVLVFSVKEEVIRLLKLNGR
jgi:hypothetical protein